MTKLLAGWRAFLELKHEQSAKQPYGAHIQLP